MIGSVNDFVARLKAVLPARWFGDETPVRDSLFAGLGAGWAWIYGLLEFLIAQTRIATASGLWLDLIAQDYFGSRLARRGSEGDDSLRSRISREVVRDRGTRAAIISAVQDLTGRAPIVFEPSYPADTGAWGRVLGYGVAGGWGSLNLHYQCFVTAYRPHGSGIALVAGWGSGAGGYGTGAIEYGSLSMFAGQTTDADIDAAIAAVLPAASTAWTQITT